MPTLPMTDPIQATYPSPYRITPQDITDAIQSIYYFTADEPTHNPELKTMTFCILRLHNGFFVVGHSAPVDPDNFDPEIGKQIAYQRAFDQLWPLLGFALKERLNSLK